MTANLEAAFEATFAEDLDTLTGSRATVYDLLMNGLGTIVPPGVPPELQPLFKFQTTYLSGVLLGLVGPVINPALALAGSVQSVFENLTGENADLEAALSTLINTPATMVDSFLNGGQSIDITPLMDALGVEHPLQELTVELTFGGLLSGAGTMFNALEITFSDGSGFAGQGPGAIGSLIALTKSIAQAIGWSGEGNPLAPPAEETESGSNERQANDTSVLAARTVPVQTSNTSASEKVDTADQPTTPAKKETLATAEQETDKEAKSQPRLKRDDSGSRIGGALERVSERLGSNTPATNNSPRKAVERITGSERSSSTGTGANKSSPDRASESKTSNSTASSSTSSSSKSDNDSSTDD